MELDQATVLIVDDEVELRGFIVQWFERAGARALAAGNGEQALSVLGEHRVDLIISDVRMPIMDGVELVKRVTLTGNYIPKMMFISGFSDYDNRELYELGVEATLRKPMRRKDIVDAARRCLADKHERWRTPLADAPAAIVESSFESLPAALSDRMIAFGRGGFCLRSTLAARDDDPVGLNVTFQAEHRAIRGHGIVRWSDSVSSLVGIELVYVGNNDCDWIIELTCDNNIRSFIPQRCA